ncbi:MAG: hypothetical protein JJ975_14645, partial [Bacteroidia bacterium]|nr:hypothetical protein [Bacteroidia bacterium]
MEKHYKTNWLSSLRRCIVLSAALLFAGSLAFAGQPLSGTYTINSASATGGTNFKSFNDLSDSLMTNGVSGAVTVNVVANSGPYSERVSFEEITGSSATNTITINGNGEKIVNTASSSVIELKGADYFTIDNLVIDAAGTGNATRCIHFWRGADYNTVKNSELIISKWSGTSSSGAGYVVFSNSTSTPRSSGNHGDHNRIDNNKMHNGGSTSAIGPYWGVIDYRSTSTRGTGDNRFTNNEVRDVYFYSFYLYYAQDGQVVGNNIHSQRSGANTSYGIYYFSGSTGNGQIKLNDNEVHNMDPNFTFYGVYPYRCVGGSEPVEVNGNKVYDIETRTIYSVRPYFCDEFECMDNEVTANSAGGSLFAFYCWGSTNGDLSRNTIHNNESESGIYGFYIYYVTGNITNNLYFNNNADNFHYGFVGGYQTSGNLNVSHNTVAITEDVGRFIYGFYQYHFSPLGSANIGYRNNIFYCTADAPSGVYAAFGWQYLEDMDWSNNDFYFDNSSTNYYGTRTYTTLAGFNGYVDNNSNIEVDPKFVDLTKSDITPSNPAIANYGVPGYATVDQKMVTRTACGPDLGGLEFYVDHNASDLVFTGKNECGGYSEEITFDFNNGTNVDLVNARAFYTINGGTPVIEEIAQIDANSSVTYTFEEVPVFHEPGTNTIQVGLLCDDNSSNNTLTTTIDITPAPHSFDITADETTYPGYYRAGSMGNPDVTVPGVEVEYEINNPAKYDNGRYGTSSDWSMVIDAYTENGTMVTSGITLTDPMSGTKGTLAFDPDPAMADSTIFLALTVTDHLTGCDSTFGRWIYVPHTPDVAWEAPDACDGDVVAFVNGTKQETGAVEYMWDFGDPASG